MKNLEEKAFASIQILESTLRLLPYKAREISYQVLKKIEESSTIWQLLGLAVAMSKRWLRIGSEPPNLWGSVQFVEVRWF